MSFLFRLCLKAWSQKEFSLSRSIAFTFLSSLFISVFSFNFSQQNNIPFISVFNSFPVFEIAIVSYQLVLSLRGLGESAVHATLHGFSKKRCHRCPYCGCRVRPQESGNVAENSRFDVEVTLNSFE